MENAQNNPAPEPQLTPEEIKAKEELAKQEAELAKKKLEEFLAEIKRIVAYRKHSAAKAKYLKKKAKAKITKKTQRAAMLRDKNFIKRQNKRNARLAAKAKQ
jgi:hypothetical protein